MKNFISIILIIFISFACSSNPSSRVLPQKNIASAAKKDISSKLNKNKTISNKTNIHYDINYCTECHTNNPKNPEIGKQDLKFGGDYKLLCKCHNEEAGKDLHPVDVFPSQEIKARMPSGFPLSDGKVTCSTCHDIIFQCKDVGKIYHEKIKFLRGGPYNSRLDQCFLCHDPDNFNRYNPHKQLDNNGDIIKKTCLYCHPEVPDVENRDNNTGLKLIGNHTALCIGCHVKTNGNSLHDKHVRTPSAEVLAQIKKTEKKLNIKFPLNEDGTITCVTCHNPHQKNLIPDYRSGAIDSVPDNLSGFSGAICTECHEMR
jgi:hypothetical protein